MQIMNYSQKEKASGTLMLSTSEIKPIKFESESPSLKEMQDMVDGYIEFVHLKNGEIAIVNEEGLLRELPYNAAASAYVNNRTDSEYHLVGNVLIIESKYVN
jgi:hypothetical protein